ncbi:putative ripening-related protein 1, partial [Tanacetum coccineum]
RIAKDVKETLRSDQDLSECLNTSSMKFKESTPKKHEVKQVVRSIFKGIHRGDRCHKYITINGNGRSVKAMVVDECDSTMGCDDEHDYQTPCPNNIVDASKAVWKALGVSENNWGDLDVTWSE